MMDSDYLVRRSRSLLHFLRLAGGFFQLRGIRPDDRQVRRCVRMHAKVPYIAVHSLFAEHFCHCVLARLQRRFGSQLDPAFAHLLCCGRDCLLLLAAFPSYGSLDSADYSLVPFHLRAHNPEPVPRQFRPLRRRVACFLARVEVYVNGRERGVYLNLRARACDFNRMFGANSRNDSPQDVGTGMTIYLATALAGRHQLGLSSIRSPPINPPFPAYSPT